MTSSIIAGTIGKTHESILGVVVAIGGLTGGNSSTGGDKSGGGIISFESDPVSFPPSPLLGYSIKYLHLK